MNVYKITYLVKFVDEDAKNAYKAAMKAKTNTDGYIDESSYYHTSLCVAESLQKALIDLERSANDKLVEATRKHYPYVVAKVSEAVNLGEINTTPKTPSFYTR